MSFNCIYLCSTEQLFSNGHNGICFSGNSPLNTILKMAIMADTKFGLITIFNQFLDSDHSVFIQSTLTDH